MSLTCLSPLLPFQSSDYSHNDLMKLFCMFRLKEEKKQLSLLALKTLREETLLGSSFNF